MLGGGLALAGESTKESDVDPGLKELGGRRGSGVGIEISVIHAERKVR